MFFFVPELFEWNGFVITHQIEADKAERAKQREQREAERRQRDIAQMDRDREKELKRKERDLRRKEKGKESPKKKAVSNAYSMKQIAAQNEQKKAAPPTTDLFTSLDSIASKIKKEQNEKSRIVFSTTKSKGSRYWMHTLFLFISHQISMWLTVTPHRVWPYLSILLFRETSWRHDLSSEHWV